MQLLHVVWAILELKAESAYGQQSIAAGQDCHDLSRTYVLVYAFNVTL